MPLQLPNLDDRTYADLADEARRLIVTYDPEWTNHNPSDPGITLLELFAYSTELLLYRMNRVTVDVRGKFLKLLAPGIVPSRDPAQLEAQIRATVLDVRRRFTAVSALDFERITLEDFNAARPAGVPAVNRAHCVPARNLALGSEADRSRAAPGHVSVVIVPDSSGQVGVPQPTQPLVDALLAFLDERRTLTTRLHVVGPTVAPIRADIVVAHAADAFPDDVKARIDQQLARFFAPLAASGEPGWTFGRDVFISELHEQLEAVAGVDYIVDVGLQSACAGAPRCVPGVPIYHRDGDLVGLQLGDDRLPVWQSTLDRITLAPSARFISVQVTLRVVATTLDPALARRTLKERVRQFFSPLHDGPKPDATTGVDLLRANLASAISSSELQAQIVAFDVSPAQRLPDASATRETATGVRVAPRELIHWRVRFSAS